MRVLSGMLVLGLASLLGACGGAQPEAKSPEDAASDVEALAEEVAAAERALTAEFAPKPDTPAAPGEAGQAGGEERKPEPPASPSPEEPVAQASTPRPRSACETACKALGSMQRSQERICELAGPSHEKCAWAKQKVADATARVERAGCRC